MLKVPGTFMSNTSVEHQTRAQKKLRYFDGMQREEERAGQKMVRELVVCCSNNNPVSFGKKPLLPKVSCTSQALCHEFFPHGACFFRGRSYKSSSE